MNLGGTIRLNRVGVILIIGVFILFLLYMNIRGSGEDKQVILSIDKDAGSSINLRLLLIAAIEAAEKGGKEVVAVRSEPSLHQQSKGKTREGANIPVTIADLKSHCVMYYNLKRTFPKIEVISEEKLAEKDCATVPLLDLKPSGLPEPLGDVFVPAEDIAVWIDPLDATQEYTEGLLEYVTTMVCVAVKGKPIIGVIHKPFADKPSTSWAWVGKAVSQDLQHTPPSVADNALRLIVSRSHAGQVLNVSRQLFGGDVTVLSAGGAGYKALAVVARNATAYVHTTAIKKWDVCAGDAILKAVGGSLMTLANEELDYSTTDNAANMNGILGTLDRHDFYIDKFSKYKIA